MNASISGETTTGGRQRIARRTAAVPPEDRDRGTRRERRTARHADPGYGSATSNYIIEKSRSTGARVLLLGMKLPPNYGEPYITQFANVYPRLAKKYHILLLPFLLEGVAADQFQADNLHPVAAAQPRIMDNVMRKLKHLLN